MPGDRVGHFPGLVGVWVGPKISPKRPKQVPNGSQMVPRMVRRHYENMGLPIQVPFFDLKCLLPTGATATLGKNDVFSQGTYGKT